MLTQWLLGCHTGETPCKLGANCGTAPQMSAQDFENNLEEVLHPGKMWMDSRLESRPWEVSNLTLQKKKRALLRGSGAEMRTDVFRAFPVSFHSPWAIENLLVCEHFQKSLLARVCFVSNVP